MRTGRQYFCLVCATGLMVIGSTVCFPVFAADQLRQWSDAKGKIKIKAKFVKLEDDMVTLEKEDGEEVEIELKKLSPADQKAATDAAKGSDDNPFKSKSDDPFKPKSKGKTKTATTKGEDDGDSGKIRNVEVDLNSADFIAMASSSDEWKVEIPAGGAKTPTGKMKPISIPSKSEFFDGLKGLAFNRGEKKTAVVGFLLDKNGQGTTRVALCDLSTGKCGAPAVAAGKMTPIALHDDGRQIVMRREEFGFGNQDRLEIWTPKGKTISKSIAWTPYDADTGGARDVLLAEFINPEQLVTSSRNGKVVIWKYPEIEPICRFDTVDGAVPALSPDRKWIAYSNGKDVGIFDIAKQEVIAQQSVPVHLQWPYMAFSPSAKRIACVAFDKVLVWDLATGELQRTITCKGIHVHGSIEFPDDDFILAGNKFLIDIENQLKLWTYDGAEQTRSVDGVTYFAVTNGDKNPGLLIPALIPHAAARDMLKKALTDPNLFVLKAGTAVRIDVNGIPDAPQRERVAKALSKQLETIGCKGGTTGTIDLVATVEGPKDTKLSFRHGGDYNFKEYMMRVKFVFQNQTAWETASSNGPGFMVRLNAGENLETHLRKLEKPSYEFFDRVELPKYLQKPVEGEGGGKGAGNSLTIGKTQITPNGIR